MIGWGIAMERFYVLAVGGIAGVALFRAYLRVRRTDARRRAMLDRWARERRTVAP